MAVLCKIAMSVFCYIWVCNKTAQGFWHSTYYAVQNCLALKCKKNTLGAKKQGLHGVWFVLKSLQAIWQ